MMPSFLHIGDIVTALKARRSGRSWMAHCPVHNDRNPSLAICERDGRVLVHCHAGCAQTDVIAVLRSRGLWRDRDHNPSIGRIGGLVSDPDWRPDCERAWYWALAARTLAEGELERLPETHSDRYPLTQLVLSIRRAEESDGLLTALYRSWRATDPCMTAGLVYAGRLSDARLQRRVACWIARGMHA